MVVIFLLLPQSQKVFLTHYSQAWLTKTEFKSSKSQMTTRTTGQLAFPTASVCLWLLIGFLSIAPALIRAQQISETEENLQQQSRLQESFQQTQMTEDGIASQLNSELIQAQLETQRLGQQFSLYRLQASTLRNLLLVSSTTIDELSQEIARQ